MSNTEETPESSRKRSSLVDEFLESGRKKARTSLSSDDKHIEDLEYMLKSVKALIKIINEIWDDCREHLTFSEANCSPFTFEREIFEEAEVEKKGRELKITTEIELNTKDFGNLPSVPEDLNKLVSIDPPEYESDILPDYNKYLEKSSILCEDVLLPFLAGFKEHLENVQVFLGLIDAWLLEPEVVISFLDQTFYGPGCTRREDEKDPYRDVLYGSYCLDVDSRMESTFDICTEKGREGLKATLRYIKIYEPVTQIEVKDAGEKAVNGTYTVSGTHNGVHFYSRSGLWDGKPAIFTLAHHKCRRNSIVWGITCEPQDPTDSFRKMKFYWKRATEEKLPPMNGWENAFGGIDPPPQILHKVDV